jgi:hypothetical protein
MTKKIDTPKLSHTTEPGMHYTACCTLADCTHETTNEEQNAKRGEFEICVKCGTKFIPHLFKPLTICDKCHDNLLENFGTDNKRIYRNTFNNIIGKWPGDEKAEDIIKDLD